MYFDSDNALFGCWEIIRKGWRFGLRFQVISWQPNGSFWFYYSDDNYVVCIVGAKERKGSSTFFEACQIWRRKTEKEGTFIVLGLGFLSLDSLLEFIFLIIVAYMAGFDLFLFILWIDLEVRKWWILCWDFVGFHCLDKTVCQENVRKEGKCDFVY